jgi:2,4-dienoyl-CoA reductase-like NADH-dependent reductase (Old Yellow Enzyme family)
MLVGTVGKIESGGLANKLLEEDGLDLIIVGRGFQKNPGLVWTWAEELGVSISLAHQIRWGFGGRGASDGSEMPATEADGLLEVFPRTTASEVEQ